MDGLGHCESVVGQTLPNALFLQKLTRNPHIQWNWKRLTLSMISRYDTDIQSTDSSVNNKNIHKLIKLKFI